MNIPQFLERLRATEADWVMAASSYIRCVDGDCPLTRVADVVTHTKFSPDLWDCAAIALQMTRDDAQAIVDASDDLEEADHDLRAQLIAATVGRLAS